MRGTVAEISKVNNKIVAIHHRSKKVLDDIY